MVLDIIVGLFAKPFTYSYKVFDQYLISNFLAFIKGFEVAIVLMLAIIFLLIAVGVAVRQAKRLPKSYVIEITDLDGNLVSINEFRQTFATYDAAESYARFYRKMYDHQYRFRVVGSRKTLARVQMSDHKQMHEIPLEQMMGDNQDDGR